MPRTYACCYCNQKFNRGKLPKHMEKHADEIPENLTPYQVAYDIINDHPNHKGVCVICGSDCGWNERTQKYHRICRDPKCAKAIKKTYQERMMKVYNKPHLMDDVNHLEKMLAHRKISGKYKWSDGTEFTYTGSYEKNFLEFLDKVMNYDSREIISPGPVLEYDYKGKKHKWITDVMILPYNLIVEIKDGGDNKNGNKAWKGTREKTIAKEVMITNLGKYNYIRLTNNDFAQFLGIIAELKMQIVDDTVSPLYRIHENTNLDEDMMHDLCTKTLTAQNIRAAANNVKSIFTGTGKADGGFWIKGGKTKEGKLTLFERIVQMPAEAICRVILIPASITADGIIAIIIGTMKLMQKKDAAGKVFKQDLINLKKQISEIEKRSKENNDPNVINKLNQLKSQYDTLSKKYSNQPIKEETVPEEYLDNVLYRIYENTNLILDSKEDREKLLDFTQNEIRELPREKDIKFIWPNQLMQSKRGNCVDVALLWYDYCKKRNREACLIRIGYSYKHYNSNNTSLSHQFHVMCMYKEDDGNWCIVNNVGPNKLSKELFIGNKSKESTISLFAKEFLPCLKDYIESIYPDAIMVEAITEIAPEDKMNKFYSTYFNKYNGNKQLFMKNIFTEDTSLDEGFIKDTVISTIEGIKRIGRNIDNLEKKNQSSYSKSQVQPKPKITERALKLKNNILQMKPSYGLNYEDCVALTSVIDSIPEDKLVNYLYKYGGYSFSELMEDRDESSDKQIKQFFKGKKLTKTLCDEGEYDLFFYCYDTKKWYQYHHEDEPCISINKAMSYSTMKQEFKKSYEIDELDEAFDVTKIFVNMVKDEFKAGVTGYQSDNHPVKLKFGERLEKLIGAPLLAIMGIPMGIGADVIVAIVKAISKIYDYKEAHKIITQKDIYDLGEAINKIKKSLKDEEEKYKEIYENVMKGKQVYLEKALPGLISIYNIPEDKMIKQLDNCTIEELFDYEDIHFKDKAFKEKYSGKRVGYLTYKYGEDGMMYCYDTKEWFIICFDVVNEPVIQSKALSYKEMYKKLQGILWSEHRDYKDELAKLEKKYKEYKSKYNKQSPKGQLEWTYRPMTDKDREKMKKIKERYSMKEESLPEAIDNPYMLREAQEWEHLTHMWDNAIDDIIGNVTNSPFEVNKGSYIDHDPETGKEVCVMRTIRPKAELKNREYRDKLKRQMYKLQQKINKAYNVHPSVMFIQYPIDNTNLTEGLIIGITKTSR